MTKPLPPSLLRRKSALERKLLLLLRGNDGAGLALDHDSHRDDAPAGQGVPRAFAALRKQAAAARFEIRPVASSMVSPDELRLLGWIAESQRVAHMSLPYEAHRMLVDDILRCGAELTRIGIRVPAGTMYVGRAVAAPFTPQVSRQQA